MIKNIYAIYDLKVNGIPGDLFTDFNDDTIKRGLQEQQKSKPISRDVASDLLLVRLGKIDYQSDLTDIKIKPKTEVVGQFTEFLTFVDET